jgi:hypothetical protein
MLVCQLLSTETQFSRGLHYLGLFCLVIVLWSPHGRHRASAGSATAGTRPLEPAVKKGSPEDDFCIQNVCLH